jgi:hypothetical protein
MKGSPIQMSKITVTQQEVVDDEDPLMTPAEVCERLKVSPRWLRQREAFAAFPIVKIGGHNRYFKSDVEEYIKARAGRRSVSAA